MKCRNTVIMCFETPLELGWGLASHTLFLSCTIALSRASILQTQSIMADDFDDLFKSSTASQSGATAGPSTPGWGGFGEDDLTTANPFADLQSSRLYDSQINTPSPQDDHIASPRSPEALAGQFEQQASLSRRSTTSSKASETGNTAAAAAGADSRSDAGQFQRSNSTSSAASTASGAGEDGRTAPSSSEGGQEQRGDRVAVSPFIAPSDEYEGDQNGSTSYMARSENTIGEPSHLQSPSRSQQHQPFWSSSNTSASVYDQEESATFGGGFNDGFHTHDSRHTSSSASTSTPSFNVHHVDEQSGDGEGFREGSYNNDQLRSRDAEDAASIRTVGLESDTASLRSHKVRGGSLHAQKPSVLKLLMSGHVHS